MPSEKPSPEALAKAREFWKGWYALLREGKGGTQAALDDATARFIDEANEEALHESFDYETCLHSIGLVLGLTEGCVYAELPKRVKEAIDEAEQRGREQIEKQLAGLKMNLEGVMAMEGQKFNEGKAEGARAERERLRPWTAHKPECHALYLRACNPNYVYTASDCDCGLTAALDAAPEVKDDR